MVNLLSRWFAGKRKVAALQAENEELKRIIGNILPHSEKYLDLLIDGQTSAAKLTELQRRLGLDSKIAYAGVG
jgi:hypothetical protein